MNYVYIAIGIAVVAGIAYLLNRKKSSGGGGPSAPSGPLRPVV